MRGQRFMPMGILPLASFVDIPFSIFLNSAYCKDLTFPKFHICNLLFLPFDRHITAYRFTRFFFSQQLRHIFLKM